MLEEYGVDYEYIKIELLKGAGQAEDYLKVHADGKVPAIDDDGFVLTESAAIMTYLGDKYHCVKFSATANLQAKGKI